MRSQKIMGESFVVAMYDIGDKKLVAVFPSANICNKYCFGRRNGAITKYIREKLKSHDNVFARTICFRNANEDQKKMLTDHPEHDFVILDERYWREGFKDAYSGFSNSTRHRMAGDGNTRSIRKIKKRGDAPTDTI